MKPRPDEPSFLDLHQEFITDVVLHASTRDRLRLEACCTTLRRISQLRAKEWLRTQLVEVDANQSSPQALARWLFYRRGQLRQLSIKLHGHMSVSDGAARWLLHALRGGSLSSLTIRFGEVPQAAGELPRSAGRACAAAAPLSKAARITLRGAQFQLPHLISLSIHGERRPGPIGFEAAISQIRSLASLALSGTAVLAMDGAFAGVGQAHALPPSLTSLTARLSEGEPYMPVAVLALTNLRSLSLQLDARRAEKPTTPAMLAFHVEGLESLAPALTSLSLASVGASPAIVLDAGQLGHLTQLRELRVRGVKLVYSPREDEPGESDSEGSGSEGEGQQEAQGEEGEEEEEGEVVIWEPELPAEMIYRTRGTYFLSLLTRLTCLELSDCGLLELPSELSRLTGLEDLSLGGIKGPRWRDAYLAPGIRSLAPLSGLPQLTRLAFEDCTFLKRPVELHQMATLQELRVVKCRGMGAALDGLPVPKLEQED